MTDAAPELLPRGICLGGVIVGIVSLVSLSLPLNLLKRVVGKPEHCRSKLLVHRLVTGNLAQIITFERHGRLQMKGAFADENTRCHAAQHRGHKAEASRYEGKRACIALERHVRHAEA